MPSLFAHYLCGKKTLELLKNDYRQKLCLYSQVFNLGTQRPDILFYTKKTWSLPWDLRKQSKTSFPEMFLREWIVIPE